VEAWLKKKSVRMMHQMGRTVSLTSSNYHHPELLENVEFRFALADTDAKFEKAISTFFAPVLLKLDSPHESVRQKVTAICGHVSKRLKANTNLAVPVESLLNLFTTDPSKPAGPGPLVKSFALIYLEMGFARLKSEEVGSLSMATTQSSLFKYVKPQVADVYLPHRNHTGSRRFHP
jgi:proteasome component ECM29